MATPPSPTTATPEYTPRSSTNKSSSPRVQSDAGSSITEPTATAYYDDLLSQLASEQDKPVARPVGGSVRDNECAPDLRISCSDSASKTTRRQPVKSTNPPTASSSASSSASSLLGSSSSTAQASPRSLESTGQNDGSQDVGELADTLATALLEPGAFSEPLRLVCDAYRAYMAPGGEGARLSASERARCQRQLDMITNATRALENDDADEQKHQLQDGNDTNSDSCEAQRRASRAARLSEILGTILGSGDLPDAVMAPLVSSLISEMTRSANAAGSDSTTGANCGVM